MSLPKGRTTVINGTLTISNFSPQDAGPYQCKATNKFGSISTVTTLTYGQPGEIHNSYAKSCEKSESSGAFHFYGKPVIPVGNQMARPFPLEIFWRKKEYTSVSLYFFYRNYRTFIAPFSFVPLAPCFMIKCAVFDSHVCCCKL